MNVRKERSQVIHLALSQRLFVGGTSLARIGEVLSGPVEQWIFAPGFAKDSDSAGAKDAQQFRPRLFQVEMVQYGATPDSLEGIIRERKPFAVRLDEIDVNLIGPRSCSGFIQITVGQIESRHASAPACQNDRGHAVAAAEIQHRLIPHVPQLLKCRSNPRFVIEICVVGENE